MQQGLALRKANHVKEVILATIARLERIIERIESRIEKIKARGGETTEAEGFVATAKDNLADATEAVNNFPTDFTSDKAQKNFETIRAAAAVAKESIRTAHTNLKNAVRSLRAVEGETDES